MTTTEEHMRKFLLADTGIAAAVGPRVAYNNVPQTKGTPYIFFQQTGAVDDIAMDDSAGTPTRPQYTIECVDAKPLDAINLKNLVHARLHKHRGTFGDTTVKGIFAADVADNYTPNGLGEDAGLHWAALIAEVVL
jgi:hypothetical protein